MNQQYRVVVEMLQVPEDAGEDAPRVRMTILLQPTEGVDATAAAPAEVNEGEEEERNEPGSSDSRNEVQQPDPAPGSSGLQNIAQPEPEPGRQNPEQPMIVEEDENGFLDEEMAALVEDTDIYDEIHDTLWQLTDADFFDE